MRGFIVRRPIFALGVALLVGVGGATAPTGPAGAAPSHGLSLFGDL